jgi:hypothetical protein
MKKTFVLLLFVCLAGSAAYVAKTIAPFLGPSDNAVEIARAQAQIEAMRTTGQAVNGLAATSFINALIVLVLVLILLVLVCMTAYYFFTRSRALARPQPQAPPAPYPQLAQVQQSRLPRPAYPQLAAPGQQAAGRWEWVPGAVQAPPPQVYYIVQGDQGGEELSW